MTEEQILIMHLSEECAEVGQRVSKYLRFGAQEVQPGQMLNNVQRLRLEVNDLLSVVKLLEDENILPRISAVALAEHSNVKRAKIMHYLHLSRSLGMVT